MISYYWRFAIFVTYCNVMGHTKIASNDCVAMDSNPKAMPRAEVGSNNSMLINIKA